MQLLAENGLRKANSCVLVTEVAACARERTHPGNGRQSSESNFLETDVLKSLLASDRDVGQKRGKSTKPLRSNLGAGLVAFNQAQVVSESAVNGFSQRYRNDFVGHLPSRSTSQVRVLALRGERARICGACCRINRPRC